MSIIAFLEILSSSRCIFFATRKTIIFLLKKIQSFLDIFEYVDTFFQVPSWLWFFFRAQGLKVFFSFFSSYFLVIELSHVFSELFFIWCLPNGRKRTLALLFVPWVWSVAPIFSKKLDVLLVITKKLHSFKCIIFFFALIKNI